MRSWSDAELDIIRRPTTNRIAAKHLVDAGYPRRTIRAISAQRSRIEAPQETRERRLAAVVMNVAQATLDAGAYKTAYPGEFMGRAVSRGFVRVASATRFRATLKGISWLERRYGSEWRVWAAERAYESSDERIREGVGL